MERSTTCRLCERPRMPGSPVCGQCMPTFGAWRAGKRLQRRVADARRVERQAERVAPLWSRA